MKRTLWLLGLISAAATVGAQGLPVLYTPTKALKDQGITASGWGSGVVSETTEAPSEGAYALRITGNNFFQGALIQFNQPRNLAASFDSKSHLLDFKFLVADSSLTLGAGGPQPTTGQPANLSPLKNLRLIITTSDNKRCEVFLPLMYASGKLWKNVAMPLKAIPGFEKTNKAIKSISISGDAAATVYVAGIQIVDDSTPIRAELNAETLDLALGDEVQLVCDAYGGVTILKVEWDFDNGDGIQVDAEGSAVRRKFRKPGRFVVTCTVSDRYGLKAPVQLKLNVRVNA